MSSSIIHDITQLPVKFMMQLPQADTRGEKSIMKVWRLVSDQALNRHRASFLSWPLQATLMHFKTHTQQP